MNARVWGIIGGIALVLALLSPLVLGSAQKVERLFDAAEVLYERSDYEGAIGKYKESLKESKKFGAKTERIDKDFTTLTNLKIARCYYELAEDNKDVRHYDNSLIHIRKVVLDAQVAKHQEELTYLWAEILYKTYKLDQATAKFSWLIEKFPNSRWRQKALYAIADINFKQENYDEAVKGFQKLIADFPHSEFKTEVEQRIEEIELLTQKENSEEDDTDDRDRSQFDSELQAQIIYENARALKQKGQIHDSYQRYTDLITKYPDSKYVTDAYIARAEIYLEIKDYVKARANYEQAMYSTADEERKIEIGLTQY